MKDTTTSMRRRSAQLFSIAASVVLASTGLASAESLKITDTQGKVRFYGDVQSRSAEVQMVITDKSGKGINGVSVELRDPTTNEIAYRAISKNDISSGSALPTGARAAFGTQAPTTIDGVVTFENVQPQTYAALVNDPNLTIGAVNVLEGAGAAGAAGTAGATTGGAVAGATGGAAAGTIGGISAGAIGAGVVGTGIVTGVAVAASNSNDSGDGTDAPVQPIPTPTPTPSPVDPVKPRPTPRPPISTR